MEKELNIAGILKLMPRHIKLYSRAYGECTFEGIGCDDTIDTKNILEKRYVYARNGHLDDSIEAECALFPSKQMQDWSKFAWKKGDVLVYIDGEEPYYAIFESFQDDEYTAFKSRYNYSGGNHWLQFNSQSSTNHFAKASDDEAKEFIKKVEEHYGGKLNLETLEIEHPKQEFKDGDILHNDETNCSCETIFIANIHGDIIGTYAYIIVYNKELYTRREEFDESEKEAMRLATEEEKQQLFSALANEGKRWNPETKQIEDLTEKCEFKAFDKVLVRNGYEDKWEASFFSYEDCIGLYYTVGGKDWCECIPYNEETAHLLGTTDEYKPKNK